MCWVCIGEYLTKTVKKTGNEQDKHTNTIIVTYKEKKWHSTLDVWAREDFSEDEKLKLRGQI